MRKHTALNDEVLWFLREIRKDLFIAYWSLLAQVVHWRRILVSHRNHTTHKFGTRMNSMVRKYPVGGTGVGAGARTSSALATPAVLIEDQRRAARESIESNIYITMRPGPSCDLAASCVADEVRDGTGQCCRVGSQSVCRCGHALDGHAVVKAQRGYMRPPACKIKSCRCGGFSYTPWWPEECGQWWLNRRGNFDINAWRQRIRAAPHDYACVGCDNRISDHETWFETKSDRHARGGCVDEAYVPVTPDISPELMHQVPSSKPTIAITRFEES